MSPVGVPLTNLFMCIVVELGTNLPDTAGDHICELQVHPVPSCEGRLQQGLKTEGIACIVAWFHHEIPSVPGEVLTIELPVDLGPPLRPHPAGEVGVEIGRASCRERGKSREKDGRRWRTRWPRDWSSDVCSSDLSRFTRYHRARGASSRD